MAGRLLIENGILALPGGFQRASVLCEGGRIVAISRNLQADGAQRLDASGLTLGPGFVDIHVHGGGGHSFFSPDPAQIAAYAAWAPRHGVTSFLVSTLRSSEAATVSLLEALAPDLDAVEGAHPLGFHLEGPFLSPARAGAFRPDMLRPPLVEEFERYQAAAAGGIRQITLAPELPWAPEVAHAALHSGAVPAMGHTDANFEQARHGFEQGVAHVTHLFNAMRPLHQRDGGPVAAALLAPGVTCELIFDGVHVSPEVLQMAYHALGPHRTVVVTDNLSLAGTVFETGTFGDTPISVTEARAQRDDGTIVGGVTTMDQHFRNTIAYLGIDLPTAFRLCSANPARVIGANPRKGVLAPGADADIVLLDTHLQVAATVCRGELAYDRNAAQT